MGKNIFLILISLLRIHSCRPDNFGTKTLLMLKGFSDKGILVVCLHTQRGSRLDYLL